MQCIFCSCFGAIVCPFIGKHLQNLVLLIAFLDKYNIDDVTMLFFTVNNSPLEYNSTMRSCILDILTNITRFQYPLMFQSFSSVTKGIISASGIENPSGTHVFSPGVQSDRCCSILCFMCNVLQMIVCPFVLFLLNIILSVRQFEVSDYPLGIFKLL